MSRNGAAQVDTENAQLQSSLTGEAITARGFANQIIRANVRT